MNTTGWVVLGVVNIPVYFGLGWAIFKDWDDFWESVRYRLTPGIVSFFRGEYADDWWAEMKLSFWMASCAACVVGEGYLLESFFG